MSKLRIWSGLIRHRTLFTAPRSQATPFPLPHFTSPISQSYSTNSYRESSRWQSMLERDLQQVDYQCQREYEREREERVKAGLDTADIDAEENEDYLNVTPILEKYKRREAKPDPREFYRYEPTDSESEDDERMSPEEVLDQFSMKLQKRDELLHKFRRAGNLNDAFQCMKRIDKFEEKHLLPRPEYRVIGELMNRLKVAEGKEKFLLQMKLNRALRMVECKEAFDPNDPANYGVFRHVQRAGGHLEEQIEEEQAKQAVEDDDGIEFDDMKQKDTILLKKLSILDKKLESKLAELDHTFGKKGKLLEEEIRDLAEERNSLTELKRKPLYRKGFDMKLIDVNRTCKVTKGGQVIKYTVMLACGNYNGVVGYAKAKGPKIPVAIDKAREKCFQNLHYVERHEDHTIAHAIHTSYKKTKVYLWPAPTQTDMKAGKTVLTILNLAGLKNVKSKVIGSRNPHNTVKAVFKALNEIETPKDVQEKFGRTVVESYLL